MSDIVTDIEMRNAAEHGLTPAYDRHLLCRAADEIKRLVAELADVHAEAASLRNEVADAFLAGRGSRMAELAKQQVEIERLRSEIDYARAVAAAWVARLDADKANGGET